MKLTYTICVKYKSIILLAKDKNSGVFYLIFTGTCLVCFKNVDHPHGKVAYKEKGDDLSAWLVADVGWRGGKPKILSRMKRIMTKTKKNHTYGRRL